MGCWFRRRIWGSPLPLILTSSGDRKYKANGGNPGEQEVLMGQLACCLPLSLGTRAQASAVFPFGCSASGRSPNEAARFVTEAYKSSGSCGHQSFYPSTGLGSLLSLP